MNIDRKNTITIEDGSIRKQFDEKKGKFYYSIVDVVIIVTGSANARNYWKVQKNRLKKGYPELVTKCNQLKMISSDGKSYMTDTADSNTLLEIVGLISPASVKVFQLWFDSIEKDKSEKEENIEGNGESADLSIDAYTTDDEIIIMAIVAGVKHEDLFVTANIDEVIIKGKRSVDRNNLKEVNIILEELYWGIFSRTISLPHQIDIDEIIATEHHGLLTIRLPKINRSRVKTIKIKSLS